MVHGVRHTQSHYACPVPVVIVVSAFTLLIGQRKGMWPVKHLLQNLL